MRDVSTLGEGRFLKVLSKRGAFQRGWLNRWAKKDQSSKHRKASANAWTELKCQGEERK